MANQHAWSPVTCWSKKKKKQLCVFRFIHKQQQHQKKKKKTWIWCGTHDLLRCVTLFGGLCLLRVTLLSDSLAFWSTCPFFSLSSHLLVSLPSPFPTSPYLTHRAFSLLFRIKWGLSSICLLGGKEVWKGGLRFTQWLDVAFLPRSFFSKALLSIFFYIFSSVYFLFFFLLSSVDRKSVV